MRDLIWTVIIIWLAYKIVDIFRATSAKRKSMTSESNQRTTISKPDENDLKRAVRKHVNREGEYIDFEETR